jgi:hypothetical protein
MDRSGQSLAAHDHLLAPSNCDQAMPESLLMAARCGGSSAVRAVPAAGAPVCITATEKTARNR